MSQKEIVFFLDRKKYRFRRINASNMIIEEWQEVMVNKKPVKKWGRVSGYHNALSIQRELLELVMDSPQVETAQTLEEYFRRITGLLADIGMRLEVLLPEELAARAK